MSDIHAANVVLLVPMSGPAGGTVFQDGSLVGSAADLCRGRWSFAVSGAS